MKAARRAKAMIGQMANRFLTHAQSHDIAQLGSFPASSPCRSFMLPGDVCAPGERKVGGRQDSFRL